jgi:hypothetical protein
VRSYLRPRFAIPYGVVLALAVVLIVFFGWAGFWLALAIFALVKVTRWGVPLIKLSYGPKPDDAGEVADADVEPRRVDA